MITAKQFVLMLIITFSALIANAQAQTPRLTTVNITPESDKVHISTIGDVTEIRVEVSDESGDVIFQSGAITGNTLDWNMTDAQGERIVAGTYLVTVTFRAASGKLRKRVEQVTIAEEEKTGTEKAAAKPAAPNAVQATIDGAGTAGKISKFTGANTIANSVITESAGKIGINTAAPVSTLTVQTAPENYGILQTAASTGGTVQVGTWAGKGATGALGGWFGTKSPHPLHFFTADGPSRMTISTNGNVGIGTINPANYARLVVNGGASDNGVYGVSVSGRAVWGASQSGQGVSGFSLVGTGVKGVSAAGHTYTNPGVYGLSTGNGGIGVIGEADTGNAWGVFGTSTSPTGYGVYGKNLSGGFAMGAEGNVTQNRDKGGWVKAMIYVNENGSINRCYNSFLTGSAATTVPCGFSVNRPQLGLSVVDFGFQVNDRFHSLTIGETQQAGAGHLLGRAGLTANQLGVSTHYYTSNESTFHPFQIIIY